jgi:hypothetical protein
MLNAGAVFGIRPPALRNQTPAPASGPVTRPQPVVQRLVTLVLVGGQLGHRVRQLVAGDRRAGSPDRFFITSVSMHRADGE